MIVGSVVSIGIMIVDPEQERRFPRAVAMYCSELSGDPQFGHRTTWYVPCARTEVSGWQSLCGEECAVIFVVWCVAAVMVDTVVSIGIMIVHSEQKRRFP